MKYLMHNKASVYIVVSFFAIMLSLGAINAAFADVIPQTGNLILLASVPLAAFMLLCAWVNYKVLIPRYLLNRKYIAYLSLCLTLAVMIPLFGLGLEAATRYILNLPARIANYFSPWILLDSLSNTALLMVILGGMGVAKLYDIWQKELEYEKIYTEDYKKSIDTFKVKIKPTEILDSLARIKSLIPEDPDVAALTLHTLSDNIRRDIYDIPERNLSAYTPEDTAIQMADFISSKRYTLLRDICLKILIACISVTAIFESADRPNLTLDGLWAFAGMFLIICLITYGAKALCRHFLYKGRIKQFLTGCVLFILGITVLTVIVSSYSYVHTIHPGAPSLINSILAIISSFCALALYLGGVIALVILHNWLCTVKRMQTLRTCTTKTELKFLQSQINPHFLFNVLNNAGILIFEDPKKATEMISQLTEMFAYQFSITDRENVKLGEEVQFLNNYLLLEESRKTPFNFGIKYSTDWDNVKIPPLLLIPFVENASKHSCGSRDIIIKFKVFPDRMDFLCTNIFNPQQNGDTEVGGLGISNTQRRLDLLYGDKYKLDVIKENNIYSVNLSIPVKYEMLDY